LESYAGAPVPPRRLLLAALVLAAAATGCGGSHPEPKPLDMAAARRLYLHTGCGECHALADAHARGQIGPDFDTSERLDHAQILQGLVEGANGMPSYAGRLSRAQRELLAAYLLRVAWKRSPG
jgi:mono/diheme cytochrome c family protein